MEMTTHQTLLLIASILGGGIGVNFAAQIIKKVFKLKADSVIHIMVMTTAIVAAGAEYILTLKTQLPPSILGVSATAIYGFSQATFRTARIANTFSTKVKAAEAILESQGNANASYVDAITTPAVATAVTTAVAAAPVKEFDL